MGTQAVPWYEVALTRAETAGRTIQEMTARNEPDLEMKIFPLLEDISLATDQIMDNANQIPEELHERMAERLGRIHDNLDH